MVGSVFQRCNFVYVREFSRTGRGLRGYQTGRAITLAYRTIAAKIWKMPRNLAAMLVCMLIAFSISRDKLISKYCRNTVTSSYFAAKVISLPPKLTKFATCKL